MLAKNMGFTIMMVRYSVRVSYDQDSRELLNDCRRLTRTLQEKNLLSSTGKACGWSAITDLLE